GSLRVLREIRVEAVPADLVNRPTRAASSLAIHPRDESVLTSELKSALDDISLDEPWSLIERFTTLKREHPDDVRIAADEIFSRLARHGVPVVMHEPELFLSLPGAASITLGDRTVRAKPMAMSRAYPDGLDAPLIYVPSQYARNADE